MGWIRRVVAFLALIGTSTLAREDEDYCNEFEAHDVTETDFGITANLNGPGGVCGIKHLRFTAQYSTDSILHVKITDQDERAYEIPEYVLPRHSGRTAVHDSKLDVVLTKQPFSFAVRRRQKGQDGIYSAGETIFNTSGSSLIFESQYWRLRTSLPEEPNLYGLGEHTDPLRLNTTGYIRTLWNRDAGAVPEGTNLYGSHPVYFENRPDAASSSTHGVALVNSNGMDIQVHHTPEDGQYIEYRVLGGVADFYFLAGPGPFDVARQYSELSGRALMIPYWAFGFHQCRYGYPNVFNVAEVVYNHTKEGIPLETMWTDIDYMDRSKVFTLDPANFPLDKMRELVGHLHREHQHYIVMVDPAIAYQKYPAFEEAVHKGILMQHINGTLFRGVVWPGETVFPDWFHPITQSYWTEQFARFFDSERGVDIDALWIDMNEPANFCPWPCSDPDGFLKGPGNWINPPPPEPVSSNPRPLPGWPDDFQPHHKASIPRPKSGRAQQIVRPDERIFATLAESRTTKRKGFPNRNLLRPPYQIHHADGPALSNHGMDTDLIHANGMAEYDVHNLYGMMMSMASREAMLARRPRLRTFVVTRSTFMGSGRHVAHWLGDNVSSWEQYRQSIRHMLQFTAFFQIPIVGADVCGFLSNTTAHLCARWARLGAFYPFFRNHNSKDSIAQEFYRWDITAQAAKKAIDLRYRLLDYIYTALQRQTIDGTPMVFPLWMAYPNDSKTAAIELQFFYGPGLLVCPVVEEGSTEVKIYLPDDLFYDSETLSPVQGNGNHLTVKEVGYTDIPVFVKSGHIIPLRVTGANTTTVLRSLDFELLVAPSVTLQANGGLYLDDGVSLVQQSTSDITFTFNGDRLSMSGSFKYEVGGVKIVKATILDPRGRPVKVVQLDWNLDGPREVVIYKEDDETVASDTTGYKAEL